MANPRATLDFEGIGAEYETYRIDNSTITYDADEMGGSAQVGKAVTMSAAATVQLVGDGEAVIGRLVSVEKDGFCAVQTGGYVKLPGGNGATLTLGKKIVGALNASSEEGYVRVCATGTAAELGVARGFIVDASTTTAVVIKL